MRTIDLPTHTGTMLPATEAAIVTIDGGKDIEFLLPEFKGNELIPDLMMMLMGCYLRLQSEEGFAEEMLDWIAKERVEANGGLQ